MKSTLPELISIVSSVYFTDAIRLENVTSFLQHERLQFDKWPGGKRWLQCVALLVSTPAGWLLLSYLAKSLLANQVMSLWSLLNEEFASGASMGRCTSPALSYIFFLFRFLLSIPFPSIFLVGLFVSPSPILTSIYV